MRVLVRPFTTAGETGNPYSDLLNTSLRDLGVELFPATGRNLMTGDYDLIHLHWPEHFMRLNESSTLGALRKGHLRLAQLSWAKRRGLKLVWTLHNLHSHKSCRPGLESSCFNRFTRLVDAVISPSQRGLELGLERFANLKQKATFIIPHGHYRDVYPNEVTQPQARKRLNLPQDSQVIGFFGSLRPNKNVESLISAFRRLSAPQLRLLIAGCGDAVYTETLNRLASGDPRIHLMQQRIPADQVQTYINAMDLVVLPFKEILTSGSAILALSFDRPVLLPNQGALPELGSLVGEQWCRLFHGRLSADTLASALDWSSQTRRPDHVDLHHLDWHSIGEQTFDSYQKIMHS